MTVATTVVIPTTTDNVILKVQGREVRLTNLRKMFWPERSITKGNLIQYYADVADVLLPHIRDRAMVMRRYPNGAAGSQFLHEGSADAASGLDPHLPHLTQRRQGREFSSDRRSGLAAVGDQSRVHRSEPVVRALR
jgi:DNA primase